MGKVVDEIWEDPAISSGGEGRAWDQHFWFVRSAERFADVYFEAGSSV